MWLRYGDIPSAVPKSGARAGAGGLLGMGGSGCLGPPADSVSPGMTL